MNPKINPLNPTPLALNPPKVQGGSLSGFLVCHPPPPLPNPSCNHRKFSFGATSVQEQPRHAQVRSGPLQACHLQRRLLYVNEYTLRFLGWYNSLFGLNVYTVFGGPMNSATKKVFASRSRDPRRRSELRRCSRATTSTRPAAPWTFLETSRHSPQLLCFVGYIYI